MKKILTLQNPLATHVYSLLVAHSDPETGESQPGSYQRLIQLSTPPQPERGPRRTGPTMAQMRGVINELIQHGFVRRDAEKNSAEGKLRLWITGQK